MRTLNRLSKPVQDAVKKNTVTRNSEGGASRAVKQLPRTSPPSKKTTKALDSTQHYKDAESRIQLPQELESKRLNLYKVTDPPNRTQLKHANDFFNKYKPSLLASFPEFRLFPDSSAPEVCFLGRSNVGKSSLINALFRGHKKEISAHVSKKAGRTTTMNAFAMGPSIINLKTHGVNRTGQVVKWEGAPKQWVGRGGLVLIDLQGYGQNSQDKWGTEIMKLLTKRKQLRRAFVLIDSNDGLKDIDINLLSLLREHGVPHQIVLTKADKVLFDGAKRLPAISQLSDPINRIKEMEEKMWRLFTDRSKWSTTGQSALCDILVTIAEKNVPNGLKLGIDALRFAILQAAALDCDTRGKRASPTLSQPFVADSPSTEVST